MGLTTQPVRRCTEEATEAPWHVSGFFRENGILFLRIRPPFTHSRRFGYSRVRVDDIRFENATCGHRFFLNGEKSRFPGSVTILSWRRPTGTNTCRGDRLSRVGWVTRSRALLSSSLREAKPTFLTRRGVLSSTPINLSVDNRALATYCSRTRLRSSTKFSKGLAISHTLSFDRLGQRKRASEKSSSQTTPSNKTFSVLDDFGKSKRWVLRAQSQSRYTVFWGRVSWNHGPTACVCFLLFCPSPVVIVARTWLFVSRGLSAVCPSCCWCQVFNEMKACKCKTVYHLFLSLWPARSHL